MNEIKRLRKKLEKKYHQAKAKGNWADASDAVEGMRLLMKNEHTPGEWNIKEGDYSPIICDETEQIIAKVYKNVEEGNNMADDETDANARLVAAAPNLLSAARVTLSMLDFLARKSNNKEYLKSQRTALRSAIDKALVAKK